MEKAISSTILRYRKLRATRNDAKGKSIVSSECDLSLLLEAWKPISMGYKKRWWDSIALPDDVDYSEEAEFRMEIKQLAFTSLELLKKAIFDKECEPLFSLEIYGHVVGGMFELNNLDLVVESPVEDYFLYIDDLPESEKIEAERTTRQFLARGDDYSSCCKGTAFYPLQSCLNHSCNPNAKARRGQGWASNNYCSEQG